MIQRWNVEPEDHVIWEDEDGPLVSYDEYEELCLLLAECLKKLAAEPGELGFHRYDDRCRFLKRVEKAVNGD